MKIPVFMSTDSATRKRMPVATGCFAYFPDGLLLVSYVSRVGNDKHRPGLPLAWDKSLSGDEKDAEARHMLDAFRGVPPDPGLEELGDLGHLASKAWRALGDLQRACDAVRAEYERTLCVWAVAHHEVIENYRANLHNPAWGDDQPAHFTEIDERDAEPT
jgi:hypothetical protein